MISSTPTLEKVILSNFLPQHSAKDMLAPRLLKWWGGHGRGTNWRRELGRLSHRRMKFSADHKIKKVEQENEHVGLHLKLFDFNISPKFTFSLS